MIRFPRWLRSASVALGLLLSTVAHCQEEQHLVVGSFSTEERAEQYRQKLAAELGLVLDVLAASTVNGVRYRVVTKPLSEEEVSSQRSKFAALGLQVWRLQRETERRARLENVDPIRLQANDANKAPGTIPGTIPGTTPATKVDSVPALESPAGKTTQVPTSADTASTKNSQVPKTSAVEKTEKQRKNSFTRPQLDVDVGLQNRSFLHRGLAGQSRWQPSLSVEALLTMSSPNGQSRFTAEPFLRLDTRDEERTHFDLRQFYWNWIGSDWDFSVGVKTVFWGVTEFAHLVDVINQTDLVENIDGEDKLGQPMAHLSLVRDWGILDFFLLVGHRPRTFPGEDGRLRFLLPMSEKEAVYDADAGRWNLDGAVRYANAVGPLSFGVYHFKGTERDPWFEVIPGANGLELQPHYGDMHQSGVDAQFIAGDWAFKLEALSRAGTDDRHEAFVAGFERTLVGVMGSRIDLGLVAEYLFDERGNDAPATLFERDVALGTRWQFNDLPDTQALLGIIWDTRTHEYIFSIEASRRLGDTWQLQLEGRWFGGLQDPEPAQVMADLLDPERKSASLQRDDLLQMELVRYF